MFFLFFSCTGEKKFLIEDFSKINSKVDKYIDDGSLALLHVYLEDINGSPIYSYSKVNDSLLDNNIDENTWFRIWSMSKIVTISIAMDLVEEGIISLDDNVSDYLPEYSNLNCKGDDGIYPCEKKLKITHLLSHRSGFTYYAKNGSNWIASLTTDLYPAVADPVRFNNLDDFSKAAAKIPLDFEPGEMYTYGINQAILGRLIEVISGQSFYSFLKENIFDKLAMNDTKFHLTDEDRERFQPLRVNIKPNTDFNPSDFYLDGYTTAMDGYPYSEDSQAHFGGEGLVSTMSDFSKFCEMLVNDGTYNGEKIVSSDGIKIMTGKKEIILTSQLRTGFILTLQYLKQKYPLHIITNGFDKTQHIKLEHSNLKPYFNQIITSEKTGVKKPRSRKP